MKLKEKITQFQFSDIEFRALLFCYVGSPAWMRSVLNNGRRTESAGGWFIVLRGTLHASLASVLQDTMTGSEGTMTVQMGGIQALCQMR